MIIVIIFGALMATLGCCMLLRPLNFAAGIAAFARKRWFHQFEITSRLVVGVVLLLFAASSGYPWLVTFLGSLLCLVSIFLIILGSERHRQFALLTSTIGKYFRYIGILAIAGGLGMMYFAVI